MSPSDHGNFLLGGYHITHDRIVVENQTVRIFATIHLGAKDWFSVGGTKALNTDCVVNAAILTANQVDRVNDVQITTVAMYTGGEWATEGDVDFVLYTMPLVWMFEEIELGKFWLKGVGVKVWKAAKPFAEMCETDYPGLTLKNLEEEMEKYVVR